jgi:class 3 adenylate cyclase
VRGIIRWLIGLGTKDGIDLKQYRTGALTNITFVVLGVIAFGAGFGVHLLAGDILAAMISIAYGVTYLVGIGVHALGKQDVARYMLVFLASAHYITICVLMGPQSGVEIYGLAFATSPFLLFARDERKSLVVSLMVLTGALLLGQFLMYAYGPLGATQQESLLSSRIFAFSAMALYSGGVIGYYRMAVHRAENDLLLEKGRTEDLLANILPAPISARLKRQESPIADRLEAVTVMFADLARFTRFANRNPPSLVVKLLDEIFCHFDELADNFQLEKIKTIGDAYMVAGGLPGGSHDAVVAVAAMAIELHNYIRLIAARENDEIGLRVGIHVGPVVAGVIWKRKFTYDLWGDAVNLASRLQEAAPEGRILISAHTRQLLEGHFAFESGGIVNLRGIGPVETYFLIGPVETTQKIQASSML